MTIGFALTGSFCTHAKVLPILEKLAQDYEIVPILSPIVTQTDTRFGSADSLIRRITQICGREPLSTIPQAEPIGPKKLLDALVIAPCTGNTLAKLSHGIADTSVTMAAKSHLRNGRPVVIAVSTNDGLGAAAENIGRLLIRKHYFFVPFGQDDPQEKPTSLVADFDQLPQTLALALEHKQIQPLLL